MLNFCIAIIMFGVALDIDLMHFRNLRHQKKAILSGLVSQWLWLPLLTLFVVWIAKPSPGLAMGMLLVSCCPGGNVSNFYTQMAGGNVALSISLTAIVSLAAFLLTPALFFFLATRLSITEDLVQRFSLSFWDVLLNMLGILLLPLILGMTFKWWKPTLSFQMGPWLRNLSMLILLGFVVVALYNNQKAFLINYKLVFSWVILHNTLAFATGYFWSKIVGNTPPTHRTLAIETGIQNSGLALVLIFTFLDAQAEMALIAAGWGVWHLISGFFFAQYFRRQPLKPALV